MTAAAVLCYKQLRLAMDTITQTLTKVSRTETHNSSMPQVAQLRSVHDAMLATFKNRLSEPAWRDAEPEYLLFLASFTACISLLTARLDQLDHAVLTDTGVSHFRITWALLVIACSASLRWTRIEPAAIDTAHLPQLAKLYATLMRLMEWLLAATRTRSRSWCALRASWKTADILVRSMEFTLPIPMNCVRSIAGSAPDVVARELAALPGRFFPLLCCLMCEQFDISPATPRSAATSEINLGYPPDKAVLLASLSTLIGGIFYKLPQERTLLDMLSCPAAIQVLKLVLVTKVGQETQQTPRSNEHAIWTLITLLDHRHSIAITNNEGGRQCTGIVGSDSEISSVSTGSRSAALLSSQQGLRDPTPSGLFHNAQLLRVLSKHRSCNGASDKTHLLMRALLRGQVQEIKDKGPTHATAPIMTSLFATQLTLWRHCSWLAMLWMQTFQTQAQRRRRRQIMGVTITPLQQEQQRILDSEGSTGELFGGELRLLMMEVRASSWQAGVSAFAAGGCWAGLFSRNRRWRQHKKKLEERIQKMAFW